MSGFAGLQVALTVTNKGGPTQQTLTFLQPAKLYANSIYF